MVLVRDVYPGVYLVDTEPFGYRGVHSAWIVNHGRGCFIVDPGLPICIEAVEQALAELALRPTHILLTHVHLDHMGCAAALARRYHVKVIVHPRGAPHVIDPRKLVEAASKVIGEDVKLCGDPKPCPPELVEATRDGVKLRAGLLDVEVIHTPGHASHHQSYLIPQLGVAFVGDGMGLRIAGCTVPDTPPPCKLQAYIESVGKVLSAKPRALLRPHYGASWDPEGDAKELLERIELWRKARSLEELYELDPCARRTAEALSKVPYFRGAVERCLQGLLNPL